jgi:hypothetical protein
MTFAGVNYGAILIAALAAWFTGAIWYGVFSKPWVAALGKTMDAFVVTTMAVNNAFSGRSAMLTVIDSGHWLAALIVMGAIIGAMGV